jgi:hypothetical protein
MIDLTTSRHYARYRQWRNALRISRSSVLLAIMAFLLLTLPVSYRAGTETTHPHTVFQVMIDQARGATHLHGSESAAGHEHASVGTSNPTPAFLNLRLPLSTYLTMVSPELAVQRLTTSFWVFDHPPLTMQPDVPELTSLQVSSELATAMFALLLVLAALLVRTPLGRIRFASRFLTGVPVPILAPPPRI